MQVKKVVIPVAGKGTRFLPVTKSISKTMLPIIDCPTIHYLLQEAIGAGIETAIIILNKEQILVQEYLTSMKHQDTHTELEQLDGLIDKIEIKYVIQEEAKGLGHAILCANEHIGNEPFAIMLGDDLVTGENKIPYGIQDLCKEFEKYPYSLIGVQAVPWKDTKKYGIIEGNSYNEKTFQMINMVEKPDTAPSNYAVLGRYILMPTIFDYLEVTKPGINQEIQLTDAISVMLKKETVCACQFYGNRYDIGSKLGYIKATVDFALKREDLATDLMLFLKEKIKSIESH